MEDDVKSFDSIINKVSELNAEIITEINNEIKKITNNGIYKLYCQISSDDENKIVLEYDNENQTSNVTINDKEKRRIELLSMNELYDIINYLNFSFYDKK